MKPVRGARHFKMVVKFACIPIKFAPKKKLTNFSLPKWRQKLVELENDLDVQSWVNNIYQERTFSKRKEFNDAYDFGDSYTLNWLNKPMVITAENIADFEENFREGGFEGKPAVYEKLVKRMKDVMAADKIVFVY